MIHIESTKDVNASPDAVWAFISDPSTWSQWMTIYDQFVEEPPAALSQGTTMVARVKAFGMSNNVEMTIDSIDAPNTLKLNVAGGAGAAGTADFVFEVQPTADGSTITMSFEVKGVASRGPMGKTVEAVAIDQTNQTLAQLVDIVLA
ncbi:SRPBCC family protein [Nocardia sp. CNY236]|uniref:type II toxin-antitoxin system Rv0910 family toxin n=1 Tax=Nocardia sp. CNY236 TaxID=1169152 RepID=UPI0004045507|nr:SRPBCC family protein [Nocardia sp. CNY236]